MKRQFNSTYNKPYHSKHVVQVSIVSPYPLFASVCYTIVRRQSKYFTQIIQWSQHGINSVPKYSFLHCVNLSKQRVTSLCHKEGNSTTTTTDMRVRYCLYTTYKCRLRVLITFHMKIKLQVLIFLIFNEHFVMCCSIG